MKTTKQQLLEVLEYIIEHPDELRINCYICPCIFERCRVKNFNVGMVLDLFMTYKPTKRKFKKYYKGKYFTGSYNWWTVVIAIEERQFDKLIDTKISYVKDLIKVLKREIKKESLT